MSLQAKLDQVEKAMKNAELLFQQLLGQKNLLVELIKEETNKINENKENENK